MLGVLGATAQSCPRPTEILANLSEDYDRRMDRMDRMVLPWRQGEPTTTWMVDAKHDTKSQKAQTHWLEASVCGCFGLFSPIFGENHLKMSCGFNSRGRTIIRVFRFGSLAVQLQEFVSQPPTAPRPSASWAAHGPSSQCLAGALCGLHRCGEPEGSAVDSRRNR